MNQFEKTRMNFNNATEGLYASLMDFITEHGGFINTQNPNGELDSIYSVEQTGNDDVAEWNVLAVRVRDNRIEYCPEYGSMEEYSDEELKELDWYDLKNTDNYYVQTLVNICDGIQEYVD